MGAWKFLAQAVSTREEASRMARCPELQKWRSSSAIVRNAHCLPSHSSGWTSSARLLGVPNTPRVLDLINIAWAINRKKEPEKSTREVAHNLYVNCSQAVQRSCWSRRYPTPTTSLCAYSFQSDMIVSGRSNMQLLGWPQALLPRDTMSDEEYRRLSGSGCSVVVLGMLTAIVFSNPFAPWW